jgi:hypothetical protein
MNQRIHECKEKSAQKYHQINRAPSLTEYNAIIKEGWQLFIDEEDMKVNSSSHKGGGVLNPDNNCTKAGHPVLTILQEKHPELQEPPTGGGDKTGTFKPYASIPTAVLVAIMAEVVETVASKLSGAAGPSGVDVVDLQNWVLCFGKESETFREEMAHWANWIAVSNPPWAAYWVLVACWLVALDKSPGTRPVGIGDIYCHLWAMCIFAVSASQATAACDNFNLRAGLTAGIEGAVHTVRHVWENPGQGPGPSGSAAGTTWGSGSTGCS